MNDLDETSDDGAQPVAERSAVASDNKIYPGTIAWMRGLTLRQLVAQPWLPFLYPGLFLEKPLLLVLLFESAGVFGGVVSGVQQGAGGGVGKMFEGALVGGFVVGLIGGVVVMPVALGLWAIRQVGRRRLSARQSVHAAKERSVADSSGDARMTQFVYRPNRFVAVFLFLLCASGEALSCYFAVARQETPFFIMAIFGPVGLIGIGIQVIRAFARGRRVAFTDAGLILPKPNWTGWSSDEIRILFSDIIDARFVPAGIVVHHRQGNYLLAKMMFPSRNDFDQVTALLVESLAQSRLKDGAASTADAGHSG